MRRKLGFNGKSPGTQMALVLGKTAFKGKLGFPGTQMALALGRTAFQGLSTAFRGPSIVFKALEQGWTAE